MQTSAPQAWTVAAAPATAEAQGHSDPSSPGRPGGGAARPGAHVAWLGKVCEESPLRAGEAALSSPVVPGAPVAANPRFSREHECRTPEQEHCAPEPTRACRYGSQQRAQSQQARRKPRWPGIVQGAGVGQGAVTGPYGANTCAHMHVCTHTQAECHTGSMHVCAC